MDVVDLIMYATESATSELSLYTVEEAERHVDGGLSYPLPELSSILKEFDRCINKPEIPFDMSLLDEDAREEIAEARNDIVYYYLDLKHERERYEDWQIDVQCSKYLQYLVDNYKPLSYNVYLDDKRVAAFEDIECANDYLEFLKLKYKDARVMVRDI